MRIRREDKSLRDDGRREDMWSATSAMVEVDGRANERVGGNGKPAKEERRKFIV